HHGPGAASGPGGRGQPDRGRAPGSAWANTDRDDAGRQLRGSARGVTGPRTASRWADAGWRGGQPALRPSATRYGAGKTTRGPPEVVWRSKSLIMSPRSAGHRPSASSSARAVTTGPNFVA